MNIYKVKSFTYCFLSRCGPLSWGAGRRCRPPRRSAGGRSESSLGEPLGLIRANWPGRFTLALSLGRFPSLGMCHWVSRCDEETVSHLVRLRPLLKHNSHFRGIFGHFTLKGSHSPYAICFRDIQVFTSRR